MGTALATILSYIENITTLTLAIEKATGDPYPGDR